MIFTELAKMGILLLFAGGAGGGGGGGGGSLVPVGPFPSPKPADLPPFPTGWCPEDPPAPEVIARAWELLPLLWGKGEGTKQQEMVGGRWITFMSATVSGQKTISVFRTTDCPPVGPLAVPGSGYDAALVKAAVVMNENLKARGYKQSDMPVYKEFQGRAGITPDGYPGTVTMLKLETVLSANNLAMANVKVYPWKATGAYDGINAPTAAEWQGLSVPAKPAPTPPMPAPPIPPPPMPGPPPPMANVVVPPVAPSVIPAVYVPPSTAPIPSPALTPVASAALIMNDHLRLHGYKQADMPIYKNFQSAAGQKAPDGFPGTNTMNQFAAALASAGVAMAPVRIYPWKSTGGYDGVNAPTSAEWLGSLAA